MKGKQIWSKEEDQFLKCLVFGEKEIGNWGIVAQKINQEFPDKSRSAKQCRERYINHAAIGDTQQSANDWTLEETQTLFYLFEKWGSRWTKISQEIKGKSENCVKNRFYGSLRKALRKMNRAAKNLVKKFKKEVKYESITRIIDASQGLFRLQSPLKEQSEELSKKILSLAKKYEEEMQSSQAEQLIIQINKFNMSTRSYKSKKKSKNTCSMSREQSKQVSSAQKSTLTSTIEKQSSHLFYDGVIIHEQHSHSTHHGVVDCGLEGVKKLDQTWEFKVDDGLINFCEEGREVGGRCGGLGEFDDLMPEILSPLECEAWM